jgi:hypothetical protein
LGPRLRQTRERTATSIKDSVVLKVSVQFMIGTICVIKRKINNDWRKTWRIALNNHANK